MDKGKETEGIIYNLQKYSVHDGPGIRTTIFFKGCPLKCFWCQNPESQRRQPEIFLFRDRCTRCGQCVSFCPSGAANLSDVTSTIDRNICVGCGKCAEVCPNGARSLIGKSITVGKVVEEVLKDRVFYRNSGGGVTLSGGEPTAQPDFALAILRAAKQEGLHTVLDTCGFVSWSTMQMLIDYVDLIYFDIKCIDADKHAKATGVRNDIILENAVSVAKYRPLKIRVPLVPGFNDSEEEIKTIVRFVRTEIGLTEIDLLPYNKLGEGKYERLDLSGCHLDTQSEEHIRHLKLICEPEN